LQSRGGKGTFVAKLDSGVIIAGAAMISDEDNILLSGDKNSVCISTKEIPLLNKLSQGNILIKNNRVLSITKI